MASIAENIVSLKFNNEQFERNVHKSINTLKDLKNSLNLESSAKSLETIEHKMNDFDVSGVSKSIKGLANQFNGLGIIGFGALEKIGARITDLGVQITRNLTQPIRDGMSTYQERIKSTQVTMNALNKTGKKGESYVTEYLDDLNKYSDETIYKFSDMTRSLSKFVSAGVNIDDTTRAIKGLGNVAALSGASTADFSRAIYNVSQSLGMGHMLTRDWMSIENANMATKGFKEQLIDTAKQIGYLDKQGKFTALGLSKVNDKMKKTAAKTVVTYKNLRDTLSYGWLDNNVLIGTLGKYSDETTKLGKRAKAAATEVKTFTQMMDTLGDSMATKWSNIYTNVIGNFNEARKFWTGVSNVLEKLIVGPLEKLQNITSKWKDIGGRSNIITALKIQLQGFAGLLDAIKMGWRQVFPPATGEMLKKVTDLFVKFSLRLTEFNLKIAPAVSRVTRGIAAALKILFNILKGIHTLLAPVRTIIVTVLELLLYVAAAISDLVYAMSGNKAFYQVIDEFSESVGGKLAPAAKAVSEWVEKMCGAVDKWNKKKIKKIEGFDGLTKKKKTKIKLSDWGLDPKQWKLDKFTQDISVHGKKISDTGNGFIHLLKSFGRLFEAAASGIVRTASALVRSLAPIAEAVSRVNNKLAEAFDHLGNFKVKVPSFLTAKKNLKDAADAGDEAKKATEKAEDATSGLTKVGNGLKTIMNAFETSIATVWKEFKDLATSGGLTEIVKSIFGLVMTDKVYNILNPFESIAKRLDKMLKQFDKTFSSTAKRHGKILDEMTNNATKFSDAGTKIAEGNQTIGESLSSYGDGAAKSIETLGNALKAFTFKIKTEALFNIAKAVALLGASIFVLATTDGEGLKRATAAVGILLGMMAGLLLLINKLEQTGNTLATSGKKLAKGIKGIGQQIFDGAFGFLNSFAPSKTQKVAGAMIGIALAVAQLATAVYMLAQVDPKQLWQSVLAVLALIGGLTASVIVINRLIKQTATTVQKGFKFIKGGWQRAKNIISTKIAGTILAIGAAVLMLAIAVRMLASIKYKSMWKGIGGVLVLMAGLTAMIAVLNGLDATKGVKGVFLLGFAIRGIAAAIGGLAKIPWPQLWNGTAALSALLIVIALMFGIIKKFEVKSVVKVAAAFLLLAPAIALIAGSMAILGKIGDGMTAAMIGLVGIVSVLVIFAAVCAKLVDACKNSKVLLGIMPIFASSMIMLGVAMVAMATAFAIMGTVDWTTILAGTAAMVAVMATFGLIMAQLTPLAMASKTLLAMMPIFAVSMVMLGMAMTAMAAAFAIMCNVDWKTVLVGTAALVAIMGVFAIITGVLGPIVAMMPIILAFMPIFAASILILSAAFLVMSTSMLVIASAVYVFVAALDRLSQIDWDGIQNGISPLTELFTALGNSMVSMIKAAVGIAAIELALLGFFGVLAVGNKVVTGFSNEFKKFLAILAGIGATIGGALASAHAKVKEWVSPFKALGTAIFGGFNSGAANEAKKTKKTAGFAVSGFFDTIRSKLGLFKQSGTESGKAFVDGIKSREALDEHSPSKVLKKIAEWAGDGFFNGAQDSNSKFNLAGINNGNSYIDGLKGKINDRKGEVKSLISNLFGDDGLNPNGRSYRTMTEQGRTFWYEYNKGKFVKKYDHDPTARKSSKSKKSLLDSLTSGITTPTTDTGSGSKKKSGGGSSSKEKKEVKAARWGYGKGYKPGKNGIWNLEDFFKGYHTYINNSTNRAMDRADKLLEKYRKYRKEVRKDDNPKAPSKAMKQFAKTISDGGNSKKLLNATSRTWTSIYAKSSDFKETNNAMKKESANTAKREKEIREYNKRIKAARKERKKYAKSNTKEGKARLEAIDEYIKKLQDAKKTSKSSLNESIKNIKKYTKTLKEGPNKAFKEFLSNVKKSVTDTLKFYNLFTANAGENIFEHFQYNDTKKNYESGKVAHNLAGYGTTQNKYYENLLSDRDYALSLEEFSDDTKEYILRNYKTLGNELHAIKYASKDDLKQIDANIQQMRKNNADAAWRNYRETRDRMAKWVQNLKDLAVQGLDPKALKQIIDAGFSDESETVVDNLITLIHGTPEQRAEALSIGAKMAGEEKDAIIAGIVEAYTTSKASDKDKSLFAKAMGLTDERKDTAVKEGKDTAKKAVNGAMKVLKAAANSDSEIVNASKTLGLAVKNGVKENVSTPKGKAVGKNFTKGIANGILNDEAYSEAKQAATTVGKGILGALKGTLKEHSPSRETFKMGQFLSMGLANGISDQTSGAVKSARSSAAAVLDGFANVSSLDMDALRPTIAPVVDQNSLMSAASQIAGLMTDSSAQLAQQAQYQLAQNKAINNYNSQFDYDDSELIDAIKAMHQDMLKMQDVIASMQLTMDTGAVVGQLVKPMDKALGKQVGSRGRY